MSHFLQVLLFLALITTVSKGAGHLSSRFGQPAVFGEILAGLLLGPSLLNLLGWGIFAGPAEGFVHHLELGPLVHDLAEIGVVLLMFVAGMETDLAQMRRVGGAAFGAALGGVILPLLSGAIVAHAFGYGWSEGIFMGAVLTATSVSISAQTLMELGRLRSKEGSTILGAAVIDDVLGIIVLALVVAFAGLGAGFPDNGSGGLVTIGAHVALVVGRMALFFWLAWALGERFLGRAAEALTRLRVSEPLLAFVVVTAFGYAWAAEYLGGIASITGSYMAGLLFSRTRFKDAIERGIHPVTYSFFVPVFFINIGLQADIKRLGSQVALTLAVIAVAVLGKVAGCGLAARLAGFTARESYRVGVGMISRGEVGLIVAGYGLARGIIQDDLFSAMVLMVLVTTMITPVWLRRVFPPGPPGPEIDGSVGHLESR